MMPYLRLKAPSVTKKTQLSPSVVVPSKQPTASTSSVSSYHLVTAAMMSPNFDATVEALGDDPGPPPARVLPEHILSSEDSNHDDSDSTYSSSSATHALIDRGNKAESISSSIKATNSNGVPQRSKARAPKKTAGKRICATLNASSASPNSAAGVPAKKRIRKNALMRSAPRATSTTTPGGLAGNSEFMNFTATIFIIQLGPDGPQFHAHESVLKRSPKLAEEIDKAKANKRATKQNILPLMAHDAIAFEQMLQFLYKDKFLMSKNKDTPTARLEEFKEVMSLAKHYVLPSLQKQVVKLISSSKILAKIPPGTFFDWAEDMYYEELDHDNGPFKGYLSKVAPMLMKGAAKATMKDLVRMVNQGGGFAEQLFIASTTALEMQTKLIALKKEEEPIRQTAREDEIMEDNEHVLVEN